MFCTSPLTSKLWDWCYCPLLLTLNSFFFFFRIINFLPVLESFLSPSLSIYIDTYCGSVSKESACNEGDSGLIPASGRSPGEGNGNPLQHSCLENPMDRGAWWATVHGSEKVRHDWVTNRTHVRAHTHTHTHTPQFLSQIKRITFLIRDSAVYIYYRSYLLPT